MGKLFEDKERSDLNTPTYHEGSYKYIERSGTDEAQKIRQIINLWFSRYPSREGAELKTRLKSSFSTALYELFIHELFVQLGFDVTVHPDVPETAEHPDFLVKKDEYEFYVEATEANVSDNEKGAENKLNTVYDTINKINSPFFFIVLTDHTFKTNNQPNGKKIVDYFNENISKYSLAEIQENLKTDYDSRIRIEYNDKDIRLVISLMPKPEIIHRRKDIRPLGMLASETYISPEESIKKSFEKKAKKYGDIDKPLLICVNSERGFGLTEHTILDIMFGPLAITWLEGMGRKSEKSQRLWEGVLGNPANPKLKKASGFLITNLTLSTLQEPRHWLVKNPFAKKALNFENLPLTYIHAHDNKTITVKKSCKLPQIGLLKGRFFI